MKKIFALLLVMLIAFIAFSAAPTYSTVDSNLEFEFRNGDTISTVAAFDTLGATDSTTIVSDFVPERPWEYIYIRDAITGTGADSVAVVVRVDCKDAYNGTVIYSVAIDTIVAAAGEAIAIPFGGTAFGNAFDIKLVSIAPSGGQLIINKGYLWRRRFVNIEKNWQ